MSRTATARGISFLPQHIQIIEDVRKETGIDGWSGIMQFVLVDRKRLKRENELLNLLLEQVRLNSSLKVSTALSLPACERTTDLIGE